MHPLEVVLDSPSLWNELPGAAPQAQREQCNCVREKAGVAPSFPAQSPPALVAVKVQIGSFQQECCPTEVRQDIWLLTGLCVFPHCTALDRTAW